MIHLNHKGDSIESAWSNPSLLLPTKTPKGDAPQSPIFPKAMLWTTAKKKKCRVRILLEQCSIACRPYVLHTNLGSRFYKASWTESLNSKPSNKKNNLGNHVSPLKNQRKISNFIITQSYFGTLNFIQRIFKIFHIRKNLDETKLTEKPNRTKIFRSTKFEKFLLG